MVEVFKTDITDRRHADMLLDQIHKTFSDYTANFDLDDCDKILRVKCTTGLVQCYQIIGLMKRFGWHAEVLPDDDLPPGDRLLIYNNDLSILEN